MRDADLDDFAALLDGVCRLLSRDKYTPDPVNTALWFRALARYDLATVRAGFDCHVCDPTEGRWVPTPAHIIGQIERLTADDGRPGAEEAWAVALQCQDEAATIVWTDEIAEAWGVARHVLAVGDEVGARMAFRECYAKAVERARSARAPVAWSASIGHDPMRRAEVIAQAVSDGRLPRAHLTALPAPSSVGLPEVAGSAPSEDVRAKLRALADQLRSGTAPDASAAAAERDRIAGLKTRAAQLVAAAESTDAEAAPC